MTAEEIRIANELFLAGESAESIGKKLHYCTATIARCLPKELKRRGRINEYHCIYRNCQMDCR